MLVTVGPNKDYRWKWEAVIDVPLLSQHDALYQWLTDTMGPYSRYGRWSHYLYDVYLFVNYEDALAFQLAWT